MKLLSILLGLLAAPVVLAATPAASTYAPLQSFAPFHQQYPVNRYRSANGMPGPDYWQNRVDYDIHATLDPASKTLSATETFTYTNNSPDSLPFLWLQLDQNRYRTDARGNFSSGRPQQWHGRHGHTDGYRIASVEVKTASGFVKAQTLTSDTRMRIDLPTALKPAGGKAIVRIVYSYTVPGSFGGRTDWYKTKNGDVYEIAQWFPRLCVYDDLRGWDTLPFLNNEFYLEYGDVDYAVTVPWDYLVAGSGQLMNPQDVLTQTQRQRVAKARSSDKTVMIRSAAEVTDPASRPAHSGTLTWRFHMHNTRDVAFGASKAYVWDAARINLPSGKQALAQSVYPVESIGKDGWQDSTQGVKFTIEYFSKITGFDYPWPNAIAEAGTAGGMEYPGIVFDWYKAKDYGLFMLGVHEFGHSWFPMIVGSNERRNAWMDEGFNTFINAMAHAAWGKTHGGQFAPKKDGEYAPFTGDPAQDIIKDVFDKPDSPPILTRADAIKEKYRHPITYFKAAYGLDLLRNVILGPERFDAAFRQYVRAWAFKHPSPSDFFRAMDSAAGEDLSWFWRGWFAHNWKLDLAVTGVDYNDNDPANGALVQVSNLDKLVLPATLEVTYVDGSHSRLRVPVATWIQHQQFAVAVDGDKRVASAQIDPDHVLPDINRDNNTWPAPAKTKAAPSKP
ncbi:MAG: M1 family metallopeptidase [Xanthomonadales bacterium]|nr:M1 family metallopeptidase [Xanthomonadales bacterium]